MSTRILIVDDETAIARCLDEVLTAEGYACDTADSVEAGLDRARENAPDVLISDIRLPDRSGTELLEEMRTLHPKCIVIMMTAYASVETAIEALKLGASDYLIKPILFDDLLARLARLLEHRRLQWETRNLRRLLNKQESKSELVGCSEPIQRVHEMIERVAPTSSTVLIRGESGTGKELVAKEIHRRSSASEGPFLAINCGAIPDTLIESELFGYRRGAFSGADGNKDGVFTLAAGGTLLLDEIGDLPLPLQPKLLRALENKEFMPLGATKSVRTDARILAATNQPIEEMVGQGRFRADLYHRLNLIEIEAPPLRRRPEDIPLLVEHFVDKFNAELGKTIKGVDSAALGTMAQAPWPGNVRELEHRLHRAIILSDGEFLSRADLWERCDAEDAPPMTLKDSVRCFERRLIRGAIRRSNGDKRLAAEELGVSLATLYSKLKEHGGETEEDSVPSAAS